MVLELVFTVAVLSFVVLAFVRGDRQRDGNAPLRNEIEARVSFQAPLYHASVLGTGGFGGTRGAWIALRGPKRLTVGTDAFLVSAPLAGRQFVFTGCEVSIALSQAPSRVVRRDWIVITGQAGGRTVRLAIAPGNLPQAWQALAGTGAAQAPAGELERVDGLIPALSRVTGWRRVALGLGSVVILAFGPALVLFIMRHLP